MLDRKTIEELEELSPQELGEILLDVVYEYVNIEYLKVLIDHGADLENKTYHSRSIIHEVVINDNLEAVKILLEAGADVNARDLSGWTSLHFTAVGGQHIELSKMLIAAGADLEANDDIDMGPLYYAAAHGHIELVKLLIAAGVYKDVKDYLGRTPWDIASSTIIEQVPELNPNA